MSTESFEALSMGEAKDAWMRQSGKGPSLQLRPSGDTPTAHQSDWDTAQTMLEYMSTHLKFNIAPENIPSQKETSPNHHFSGAMFKFGGVYIIL